MRKLILIVQTSLDGFVAGKNGEFDHFIEGEENLAIVCGITDDADAALFGRISYQLLNSHWPTAASKPNATANMAKYSNWYNAVPKYVLSKTLANELGGNTFVISDHLESKINAIKHQPGKNILIFGSPTACYTLFDLNIMDGFWIIVHPVIFGAGIPFFRENKMVTKLELLATHRLSNGTLCNYYSITK